jgi:gas vesicle protein
MQTQITCPNCGTPYAVDIYQVIDARRQPQLKEQLLTGQLNFAVCPSCGAGGRIATPLLYHDPAHDLFMVHVPQELNLDQMRREEMIGRLVQQVMNATPQEQRRGYMLQPQIMLTMQGFLEKVLETEGVTPDMIARQQKQAELLRTMSTASPDVVDFLLKERGREIDETFFAMLRSQIEALSQTNDPRLVSLLNLQARLMTETEVGRQLEKRQIALHALNRDVQKEQGLTPKLLLKHVLLNKDDEALINAIGLAGQQAMTYEFFTLLTAEVDKAEKAKDVATARKLGQVRDQLLKLQDDLRQASQQVLKEAQDTLDEILKADDLETAIAQNMDRIDDAFLHVMQARAAHAEQSGRKEELAKLDRINDYLMSQIQQDVPPALQFLNELMMSETSEQRRAVLDRNRDLVSPELLDAIVALQKQSSAEGRDALADQLGEVAEELRVMVEAGNPGA